MPDRHARGLAENVPQGDINRGEASQLRPLADGVRDDLVESPPVQLDGQRVVPKQHRGGKLVNVASHGVRSVARIRVTDQARVRVNGDEQE